MASQEPIDAAWAEGLIGKSVLIECTLFEADDVKRERPTYVDIHGDIVRINEMEGVVIKSRGFGEELKYPIESFKRFFQKAKRDDVAFIAKGWATMSDPNALRFEGFSQN